MAPSSTRMRSAARRRSPVSLVDFFAGSSADSLADWTTDVPILRALRLDLRTNARTVFIAGAKTEQVANRVNEVGAVHGVKVEIADAVVNEIDDLFGGDGCGDELARRRVFLKSVEAPREPIGHRGAGACCEAFGQLEVLHRQDAGHDRNIDAARTHAVEIAKVQSVVEKEL